MPLIIVQLATPNTPTQLATIGKTYRSSVHLAKLDLIKKNIQKSLLSEQQTHKQTTGIVLAI